MYCGASISSLGFSVLITANLKPETTTICSHLRVTGAGRRIQTAREKM